MILAWCELPAPDSGEGVFCGTATTAVSEKILKERVAYLTVDKGLFLLSIQNAIFYNHRTQAGISICRPNFSNQPEIKKKELF